MLCCTLGKCTFYRLLYESIDVILSWICQQIACGSWDADIQRASHLKITENVVILSFYIHFNMLPGNLCVFCDVLFFL